MTNFFPHSKAARVATKILTHKKRQPLLARARARAHTHTTCCRSLATDYSEPLACTAPDELPPGGVILARKPPSTRRSAALTAVRADDVVSAAPLPEWKMSWCTERNRPYYYNLETQRSQWTPPLSAWQ